jgi:hypothetical protein
MAIRRRNAYMSDYFLKIDRNLVIWVNARRERLFLAVIEARVERIFFYMGWRSGAIPTEIPVCID